MSSGVCHFHFVQRYHVRTRFQSVKIVSPMHASCVAARKEKGDATLLLAILDCSLRPANLHLLACSSWASSCAHLAANSVETSSLDRCLPVCICARAFSTLRRKKSSYSRASRWRCTKSRINSRKICEAGRWPASAAAINSVRNSGSNFMVKTASLDMIVSPVNNVLTKYIRF